MNDIELEGIYKDLLILCEDDFAFQISKEKKENDFVEITLTYIEHCFFKSAKLYDILSIPGVTFSQVETNAIEFKVPLKEESIGSFEELLYEYLKELKQYHQIQTEQLDNVLKTIKRFL